MIITLDSSDETMDEVQLTWLENTLKKIRPMFKNCIIFGHVPPVNSRPDYFGDHVTTPETTEKFVIIIKKHKINAMFFGHVHFFSKARFANIDFWTTPSSGQSVRNPENPKFGYVTVKISKICKVDVKPEYIDFRVHKHTFFTEWFTRDISSVKVRMLISTAGKIVLLTLILGIICRIIELRHKRK
ncbi:MAG: hypothetical protein J6S57_01985 [Alphaproteobacteria bacterium]|nr:hypothetical protein [Alphaproteobacteria bacterium]